MQPESVLEKVRAHLKSGGRVKLSIDKAGRRLVKLCRFGIFGSTFEISGATEATIKTLLIEKRRKPSKGASAPARVDTAK